MTAPVPSPQPDRAPTDWKGAAMQKRIAARYSAERRFRTLGLTAIVHVGRVPRLPADLDAA
jgi:phosphate transport system permease protein